MKLRRYFWLLAVFLLMACENNDNVIAPLINSDHLNHLYETWDVGDHKVGGIWIYCEAPDYHLVGDEDEGFTCVDDVARSLVFYCKEYETSESVEHRKKIIQLSAFILHLQAENGFFYNFVFPDKSINKTHQNSVAEANWWSWRAFWALSEVVLLEDSQLDKVQKSALEAMEKLLPAMLSICSDPDAMFQVDGISSPSCAEQIGGDQIALLMIGLSNYYLFQPSEAVEEQLLNLGRVLIKTQAGSTDAFPYYAYLSWQNIWHAWGNSQAYAMLKTGRLLDNDEFVDSGMKEVDHFYPYYLEKGLSHFKIANGGDTIAIMEKSYFPQIAYNLRPMIFASLLAYDMTRDVKYAEQAAKLGNWYFGKNQANQKMYDETTGRTYDGIISASEVNRNSGAESTIEALLALQAISEYPTVLDLLEYNEKQ